MTALVKPVTNFYTMTAAKNRRISQGSAVGGITEPHLGSFMKKLEIRLLSEIKSTAECLSPILH